MAGFSAGDEFDFGKFPRNIAQKFAGENFFSGGKGDDGFRNAFYLRKFFEGKDQKRFALNFLELFWKSAAGAFAGSGGEEDETDFH